MNDILSKLQKYPSWRSLRAQTISLLVLVISALVVIITAGVYFYVYSVEQEAWRGRQSEAARSAAQTVTAFLQEIENTIRIVALFGYDEILENSQLLAPILEGNSALLEISVISREGSVLASVFHDEAVLANLFTISQSKWFNVARQGQSYFSRIQISSRGEPYILFAIPAQDGGVIAARVRMDVISHVVSDIRFGDQGKVYIMDDRGQIIAHTNPEVVQSSVNLSMLPEYQEIISAPEQWFGETQGLNGQTVVIASAAIPETGWILLAELPASEAYNVSRRAAWQLTTGLAALGLLATMALSQALNRLVLLRLDKLREGALTLGQGKLAYRIPVRRMDELGEVMLSFNEMADRLAQEQLALKKANEELETRVQARTQQLQDLNYQLALEVSERTVAEQKALQSLDEKEVLLKEIHHRVKNNLQIITSLLSLQARKVSDSRVVAALEESQHRVRSMALIHEKLYQSGNLAVINLGEYIQSLTKFLTRAYQSSSHAAVEIEADDILLDLEKAVPCGLILNELVTNALKYAFTHGQSGKLHVQVKKSEDTIVCIQVCDNGIGLPKNMDFRNSPSLGLQLVNSLVDQLEGQIELETFPITEGENRHGTCFTIHFPARK